MKYIHVKKLDKYNAGYKDRNLFWCKAYFNMINADPEFEMLCEIDKWRFIAFIMLELQLKKIVPLNDNYLKRKGFDLKKRAISLTLKMLHNFIEVVTEDKKLCSLEVDKEVDKEIEKNYKKICVTVLDYFNLKSGKKYTLTTERERIVKINLNKKRTVDLLKKAIDNFVTDDWPDRYKYMDLVYCIGVRNGVDNFEKWYNYKSKNKSGLKPLPTDEELKKFNKENN